MMGWVGGSEGTHSISCVLCDAVDGKLDEWLDCYMDYRVTVRGNREEFVGASRSMNRWEEGEAWVAW